MEDLIRKALTPEAWAELEQALVGAGDIDFTPSNRLVSAEICGRCGALVSSGLVSLHSQWHYGITLSIKALFLISSKIISAFDAPE